MEQKINLNVNGENKEIVFRMGEALKEKYPNLLSIKGDITAPQRMHKIRWAEEKDAYLMVDVQKGGVELYMFPEDAYKCHTVSGALHVNPDFAAFQINTGTRWSLEKLASFLKQNRMFFPDKEEFMAVIAGLKGLKGKINTEVESISDARGSKRELIDKVVSTNLPENFKLSVPIHTGHAPVSFLVEVEIEIRDTEISCILFSAEAIEIKHEKTTAFLQREMKYFEGKGIPVII